MSHPPPLPSPPEISANPEEDSPEGRARHWASVALSYRQQMLFCNQQLAEINAKLQLRTEPKMPRWYVAQSIVLTLLVLLRIFDAYAQHQSFNASSRVPAVGSNSP